MHFRWTSSIALPRRLGVFDSERDMASWAISFRTYFSGSQLLLSSHRAKQNCDVSYLLAFTHITQRPPCCDASALPSWPQSPRTAPCSQLTNLAIRSCRHRRSTDWQMFCCPLSDWKMPRSSRSPQHQACNLTSRHRQDIWPRGVDCSSPAPSPLLGSSQCLKHGTCLGERAQPPYGWVVTMPTSTPSSARRTLRYTTWRWPRTLVIPEPRLTVDEWSTWIPCRMSCWSAVPPCSSTSQLRTSAMTPVE